MKILVVDNNAVMLRLMTSFLAKEGHDVKGAEDAFAALDILREFIPQIIFLDLVMPKIGGESLCKIFRAIPQLTHCYIAIVSAVVLELKLDLLEIGADTYIVKDHFSKMQHHILETIAEFDTHRSISASPKIRGNEKLHSRQITKELLFQRKHQQIILESISQGVLAVTDNRVFYANQAALSLLQVSIEHLLGDYLDRILAPPVWEKLVPLIETKTDGPMADNNIVIKIHDRYIMFQCLTIQDDRKNQVVLLTDITAHKQSEEALKESETKYRSAFTLIRMLCDNVPDMIWAKDLERRYIFANKAICCNLLNAADTDEPIGKMDMFFAERERVCHDNNPAWHTFGEICEDSDAITMNAGSPQHFDEYGNVQGKFLFLDVHKAPFLDETGRMIGTVGSARDVTTTKELEQKLKKSEARLQTLVQTIPDLIWLKDRNGVYLDCNEIFERTFGVIKKDIIGKTDYDFLDKDLADSLRDHDRNALESSEPNTNEEWLTFTDNGCRSLFDTIRTPMFDADGKILGVLGVARDITERKRAAEALRESEERYQSILNASPDNITMTDFEGRILMISPAGLTMFGYDREEEVLGDLVTDHLAPEDRDRALSNMALKALGVLSGPDEYRGLRKDGSTFDIEVKSDFIRDVTGRPVKVVIVVRDITERKLAAAEREKMQALLNQAQKMEAIGTLAGGIAHDFNNILGAILGYAELAQEDIPAGSMVANDIAEVVKASHRAKELVKQILAFSRQTEVRKINLSPATIVKESIKLLRSSIPTTIDIQQEIDPETALIHADPTQIHQIIMNLCTNAYHAMEVAGGCLSVSLKNKVLAEQDLVSFPSVRPGHFVQLSIKDTGSGIAPEIREKIFDPYFTTKETGKGTGMGLAIVHGITKSYGGFITCNSEIERGTVFTICLPALLGQIGPESQEVENLPVGTERILIIDDEKILLDMGRTMLERIGYKVTAQTSSLEALTTFQNQPDTFDLVITDQTMPGITGFDLARRMLQIRPDIPIILCTGYSSQVSEEKARAYGIKGFTMKPLSKKDITTLIRKVLDEGKSTL